MAAKEFGTKAEAEAFVRVEFNFQLHMHGTVTIHLADCGLDLDIKGLKEDMKTTFANLEPHEQIWSYLCVVLEDDRPLRSYGLSEQDRSREPIPVKIFVKRSVNA